MTTLRIPAGASLPPAFTARERAAVDAYFRKRARAARADASRSSLVVAIGAVALAIGLMFSVHGPAHADRIPAGILIASLDDNGR